MQDLRRTGAGRMRVKVRSQRPQAVKGDQKTSLRGRVEIEGSRGLQGRVSAQKHTHTQRATQF